MQREDGVCKEPFGGACVDCGTRSGSRPTPWNRCHHERPHIPSLKERIGGMHAFIDVVRTMSDDSLMDWTSIPVCSQLDACSSLNPQKVARVGIARIGTLWSLGDSNP